MKKPEDDPLAAFSRFAGELAESFSFNRSLGQIYGLLYASSEPLSLDDIAKTLRMSKGNASVNLRSLEAWDAVRPVSVAGSRRDHYEANRGLKEIAARRLNEGLAKRMDFAEDRLRGLARLAKGNGKEDGLLRKVQELESLLKKGRKALGFLSKWLL